MRQFFKLMLLFGFICFAQKNIYAQETEEEIVYQIKMYYNFVHSSFEYEPTAENLLRVYESEETDFGYITPALTITKNRMKHEIELSALRVKRDEDFEGIDAGGSIIPVEGSLDWQIDVGLRYEFMLNFLRDELRHGLFVGTSVAPYFNYWNTVPKTSASFPANTKVFGTRLHLIPRYTYDISKKWFVDVNFPIEVVDAFVHRNYWGNPILSSNERVRTDIQANFFDNVFRFRIGIGLKL